MTQSTYSGGVTDTSRRDYDDQSSNEIRADINQTRASVGDKIDQLQARLDPNRLKAQAQETVQEMISDTASSMTDYVRTHKDEMVSSLADAARRNPLPTALVGLGIGWLILESMSGKKDDDDRARYYEYERRNFRPRARRDEDRFEERSRFEGSSGRSFVSRGRGQYLEGQEYAPEYYDRDYSGDNPAGYYLASDFDTRQGGNGHHRNPVAKATDAVKDKVEDVVDNVKDAVGDVTHEIKERVGDATQEIRERVGDAVSDVRRQVEHVGDQGQDRLQSANQRMNRWERRARYEGRRRGQQVMRNLEDNPLTYGALALAAGAALALFLPQTRTENRAFGEMRDQVMQRGQEVMESAKSHAQEVIAEVRPELEEKARQIASDAKEMGKEVVKDAAAELRPVVDKAVAKGKDEARAVAQEAGIDPDKLTGKKPALNRDTLAGQWKQVRGEVKRKWGQLTDDELTRVEGDYEKLVGAIQTRYGRTRAQVEQEVNDFFKSHQA